MFNYIDVMLIKKIGYKVLSLNIFRENNKFVYLKKIKILI